MGTVRHQAKDNQATVSTTELRVQEHTQPVVFLLVVHLQVIM